MTKNYEKEVNCMKQCFVKEFKIKELKKLKYFQGIEVV